MSVNESLHHAGYYEDVKVNINWVDSEEITKENVADKLAGNAGVIIPGGFGHRGIEGIICAVTHARENKVPCFGICLGMQLMAIEFARNVCGLDNANSIEFDPTTKHPLIHLMQDQDLQNLGGTQRLGVYDCHILPGSKASEAYKQSDIQERHRHRYEFNNNYRDVLERHGMNIVGVNLERDLVEIIELEDHPFYVAGQFHPEFGSRPNKPHPLFEAFIHASKKNA